MILDTDNLDGVSLADLEAAYEKLSQAIDQRLSLDALKQQAANIAQKYEEAVKDKPAKDWAPGLVVGPGDKVIENGEEWVNVSGAWLSAPPSAYPLGYRRTGPPVAPVLPWVVGETVKAGDLRSKGGVTYQVVTGHTTAAHWAPDLPGMTALWIPATVTNATPGTGKR